MMNLKELPTLEWLRANGRNIRMHGNRFIQIDLDEHGHERIHVWADILPAAQRRPTLWHNHAFSFESTLLAGELLNLQVEVRPVVNPDHFKDSYAYLYEAKRQKKSQDTTLVRSSDDIYELFQQNQTWLSVGQKYRMDAGDWHANAYVGHAITYMQKETLDLRIKPQVACATWYEPDNEWKRDALGSSLWGIVDQVWEFADPRNALK